MGLPSAICDLPGELLPPGLVGAGGQERAIAAILFEQRRCEGLAYCRTMTAVYALHRVMYADDEAEYLARPGDLTGAVEARRSLTAAGAALEAQVSTLLRLGSTAARLAIETAIGFVERLPRVFALIGENVISPKAGEAALHRSRALDGEQARRFDALLAERLTVEYEVLSLPALREAADEIVGRIDAEAAERRRRAAVEDRRVTFRPEQDGMAAVFALMPAEDVSEVQARVEHMAGTVCDADPRTRPQRRADGWLQLARGFSTLGCRCGAPDCRYREARCQGEPDADGVITRFVTLVNVVINERDMVRDGGDQPTCSAQSSTEFDPPSADDAEADIEVASGTDARDLPADASASASTGDRSGWGYLVGHGLITGEHARELAARDDAKIQPFGQRIHDAPVPAAVARHSGTCGAEPRAAADAEGDRRTDLGDGDPRGRLDVAAVWAEIVVRLEGHEGPGDGGAFDDVPPGDGPSGGGPTDGAGDGPPGGGPTDRDPTGGCAAHDDRRTPTSSPARADAGDPGAVVTARGSSGYRPSADLRRYLRLVFPRCVFPYCTRPASRAQLDHRREYDHADPALGGGTTAEQIQPLCVAHHQLKTAGEWIDARLPDGRILWTSPDGRRYIVDPSGSVLALFPDLQRVRWIVPEAAAQSIPCQDTAPPGGRTRLQREHARRERLRQRNIAAMEAELDRARTPASTVEEHLAAALAAPRPPRPAPSFDGPPPF